MDVEAAAVGDVDQVREVVERAYRGYVVRMGALPAPMTADYDHLARGGELYVIRREGRVVGVIAIQAHGEYLLVGNVAVSLDWQGCGVGARLLDFADGRARELGLREVRLYTNTKMTENLAYYPRRGFIETGRSREDGFDRVYFSRRVR